MRLKLIQIFFHNSSLTTCHLSKRAPPPIESPTYIYQYLSMSIPFSHIYPKFSSSKKALSTYPIKKFEETFIASIRYPFERGGENRSTVAFGGWPSRCFDHGDPPSVAHITKPVVPLSRVYNVPLYNTFHRDNRQLLPPGFKSAVSISPTAVSRGAR